MISPASLGSVPGPPSLTTSAISFQHGEAARLSSSPCPLRWCPAPFQRKLIFRKLKILHIISKNTIRLVTIHFFYAQRFCPQTLRIAWMTKGDCQNPTPTLRKIPGDKSRSAQSYSFQSHSHANLSKAFRVIVLTNTQTATITEGQSLQQASSQQGKGPNSKVC